MIYDFNAKYNRDSFLKFLNIFLPKDFSIDLEQFNIKNKLINKVYRVGDVPSLNSLSILEIEHNSSGDPRNLIFSEITKIMNGWSINNCLVIIFSKDSENYRLSLIESKYTWTTNDISEKKFTSPKRLSFYLGKNSRTFTIKKQLVERGQVKNFEDLHSRFSVEPVTKEFFASYKKLCLSLRDELNRLINDDASIKRDFNDKKINSFDFSKKIMNQIIFIYFVQRKGWLGIHKTSSFDDSNGDKNFLQNLFNKKNIDYDNFYNDIFEYLIYDELAVHRNDHISKKFNCKLPFLNISLFEPFDDYDWKNTNIIIENKLFSEIFEVFDRFNFTVDENTQFDTEIAVDPEMLGMILENLMETNEKRLSGTYFTPKNIVSDTCKEVLGNYLYEKLNMNQTDLFDYNNKYEYIKNILYLSDHIDLSSFDDDFTRWLSDNSQKIYQTLNNIKILDPAVGSGAFLVEMHKIISQILYFLSTHFENGEADFYKIKKNLISNCLYGADINPIHSETAMMRLWLALIVATDKYNLSKSLPNLEYNLLIGDSLSDSINLLDVPDQSHIENLKCSFKEEVKSKQKKKELQKRIDDILFKNTSLIRYELVFNDIFKKNKGFDIIIGNPPWEVMDDKSSYSAEIERINKTRIFSEASQGKLNYFKLFINKSLTLLSKGGYLSFVVQNSIIGDKTCSKLRDLLFNNYHLKVIHSFPERDSKNKRVFESAKMSVAIITIGSLRRDNDKLTLSVWKDRNKKDGTTIQISCKELKGFDRFSRIPLFDDDSISLYKKIKNSDSSIPLSKICGEILQGEVNVTFHKSLYSKEKENKSFKKLYPGASIQKYFINENPSQGSVMFLDEAKFKEISKKSHYAKKERIAMQGITGTMDYRLVNCIIPPNVYLKHSANFLVSNNVRFANIDICCYLNTKLCNWMFRMFSTNSNVNNYELFDLPLIPFTDHEKTIVKNAYVELSKFTADTYKSDLFKNHEAKLDSLIYSKYNLSENEISIIESKFN